MQVWIDSVWRKEARAPRAKHASGKQLVLGTHLRQVALWRNRHARITKNVQTGLRGLVNDLIDANRDRN